MISEEAFELLAGLVHCQDCKHEIASFPPDHIPMLCNILVHRSDNVLDPIKCEWFRARLV